MNTPCLCSTCRPAQADNISGFTEEKQKRQLRGECEGRDLIGAQAQSSVGSVPGDPTYLNWCKVGPTVGCERASSLQRRWVRREHSLGGGGTDGSELQKTSHAFEWTALWHTVQVSGPRMKTEWGWLWEAAHPGRHKNKFKHWNYRWAAPCLRRLLVDVNLESCSHF